MAGLVGFGMAMHHHKGTKAAHIKWLRFWFWFWSKIATVKNNWHRKGVLVAALLVIESQPICANTHHGVYWGRSMSFLARFWAALCGCNGHPTIDFGIYFDQKLAIPQGNSTRI